MKSRPYLRHLWSHQRFLHRALVKNANLVLRRVPDGLKYGLGERLRSGHPPYCFVRPGDVVLQVGAPKDTLLSGRSRAAYFTLLAGKLGRVLIVEPDGASVEQFRKWASTRGLHHATVEHAGAWSRVGVLRVFVDDSHPAANFTEGTTEYDAERLSDFREVVVPATTIDELVAKHDPARVDLVSITTNGAEIEILDGAAKTIERFHPVISLARTRRENLEKMASIGYETLAADDRGYTFVWRHR